MSIRETLKSTVNLGRETTKKEIELSLGSLPKEVKTEYLKEFFTLKEVSLMMIFINEDLFLNSISLKDRIIFREDKIQIKDEDWKKIQQHKWLKLKLLRKILKNSMFSINEEDYKKEIFHATYNHLDEVETNSYMQGEISSRQLENYLPITVKDILKEKDANSSLIAMYKLYGLDDTTKSLDKDNWIGNESHWFISNLIPEENKLEIEEFEMKVYKLFKDTLINYCKYSEREKESSLESLSHAIRLVKAYISESDFIKQYIKEGLPIYGVIKVIVNKMIKNREIEIEETYNRQFGKKSESSITIEIVKQEEIKI